MVAILDGISEYLHSFGHKVFYSHDFGKRLPDGNLLMCGRMNDSLLTENGMIVGLEIELAVQKTLGQHGAYVKLFQTSDSPAICLYTDFDIDFPKLQEELSTILPKYKVPTDYVRVRRFVVNNGKVIRSVLLPPDRLGELIIRDATVDDAPFIAWAMTEAIPDGKQYYREILDTCQSDDMIYSFRRTRIAEIGGIPVGCQVATSGMDYKIHRKKTWLAGWPDITDEQIDNTPFEAEKDEYFLNGIAVLPEYRGQNVSEKLISDFIGSGEMLGFKKSALTVEISKPHLVEHYQRMGFKIVKGITLFGTDYYKMNYEKLATVHLDSCGYSADVRKFEK